MMKNLLVMLLTISVIACGGSGGTSKSAKPTGSSKPAATKPAAKPPAAPSTKLVAPENLANGAALKRGMTDSEFAQAYAIASKIAAPYAGKSREKQLEGIAKDLYQYKTDKKISYSDTAPHYNDVYGFYIAKVASCAGATRAVGLCLSILDIPYTHMNENQWDHQWCRVKIGNTDWLCDVYVARYGPESNPLWAIQVSSNTGTRVEWKTTNIKF